MKRPWNLRATPPAIVPPAYPPNPLVVIHSRSRRYRGSSPGRQGSLNGSRPPDAAGTFGAGAGATASGHAHGRARPARHVAHVTRALGQPRNAWNGVDDITSLPSHESYLAGWNRVGRARREMGPLRLEVQAEGEPKLLRINH